MPVQTLNLFFSLLTVAVFVLGIVAWAGCVSKLSNNTWLRNVAGWLEPACLWFGALIATSATLGSLYYSEVIGFEPCKYCWFQRAAMYPTAVLLVVAAIRKDIAARFYILPLTILGGVMSAYHFWVELSPLSGGSCSPTVPCNTPYFQQWGFVSLAFMALVAFFALSGLILLSPKTVPASNQHQ